MKKHIILSVCIIVLPVLLFAQRDANSVAITYPHSVLSFHVRPGAADAVTLPMLQAKSGTDVVGILFGNIPQTQAVFELVDAQQKIIRSISAGELMGNGGAAGVRLLSAETHVSGSRASAAYLVPTSKGSVTLLLRVLAGAEKSTSKAPASLVVTIALKSKDAQTIALRAALPVKGVVEAKANGFVVTGKAAACFAAAISPQPEKLAVANDIVSITTKAVAVPAGNIETPLLWLTVEATTAPSAPGAKTEATAILAAAAKEKPGTANVVIVTAADKQNTAPGDTVTYMLVCSNIGTGDAKDIELSNPIPAGTRYLISSAVGDDTIINVDMAVAEVTRVRWKLRNALKPGNETIVTFKVIVL